jgi:putative intracellular protease/amidase
MKRLCLRLLFLVVIIGAIPFGGCARQPQILIYVRDGSSDFEYMLTQELGVMKSMLEEAGLRAVVATESEESYYHLRAALNPDISLTDVEVSQYAGFLLPCMAAGAPGFIEAEAIDILKEAVAKGKPIAAQHGSVFILARAGLLNGKHYAYELPRIKEGIYSGNGVVQDGLIITSGICPYEALRTGRPCGTAELTRKLIETVVPPVD